MTRHQQIMDQVLEHIGQTASTRTVFGDPIESHGLTIIPVASVSCRGGGGSLGDRGTGEQRSGGALGLALKLHTTPVGYIIIQSDGTAQFKRILDLNPWIKRAVIPVGLFMAGGLILLLKRYLRP